MDLILGHNQFIGISHISEERSREREKKFSNVKNIYHVVEKAADLGYKGMIIETHPRMLEFIEYYKKNKTFDMSFYLQVPHVQGYVQKVNEKGLSGLISEIVGRSGIKTTSVLALKNIMRLAKKDYLSMATSALQLEVAPFKDIDIKAVLLHNIITDLLLSLQISDAFNEYMMFVEDKLKLNPGFVTQSIPLLKSSFDNWNFKPSLVMTSVNIEGYNMNPSKDAVETAIRKYDGEIIAMNVLGGGAFSIGKVRHYMESMNNIKFCAIGASSENHLRELIEIFGD